MNISSRNYTMSCALALLLGSCQVVTSFTLHHSFVGSRSIKQQPQYSRRHNTPGLPFVSLSLSSQGTENQSPNDEMSAITPEADINDVDDEKIAIRAPLKYIGPYPCLSLRFPNLDTSSQRTQNISGVALDFVLDTAANTNTIQQAVASELLLEAIGMAPGGVGAAGAISGGETFMLGDCQLDLPPLPRLADDSVEKDDTAIEQEDTNTLLEEEDEEEESFLFMTNLSASALPVASPAAAGLLSVAFLNCFPGGVEFEWSPVYDGATVTKPASVTFHGTPESCHVDDLAPVPITPLEVSYLPSIDITVNGVSMKALLDTGSPITVLNAEAARLANVDVVSTETDEKEGKSKNPFAAVFGSFAKNAEKSQAVARGDILMVAGTTGERVELIKTSTSIPIEAMSSSTDSVVLPSSPVYVGDLPGLAALGGLGASAPPAVILGMDVLRYTKRMVYRQSEVYFE